MTGARYHRLSPMPVNPLPMEMAQIQLDSWACDRPAASAAWNISAAGPA